MKKTLNQELDGMSAVLASPTYGPCPVACSKALRVAVMTAANHGLQWMGDMSTDKERFGDGRNRTAKALWEDPVADGIVWVDSDIILRPESILRLMYDVKTNNCEFITGIYHKKGEPFEPVLYAYVPDTDGYVPVEQYDPNPGYVVPVDACGFGFCYTSVKCLQEIAKMKSFDMESGMWFPDTRNMPPSWRDKWGRPGFGEDFSFCDKARIAGIQLYVDTGITLDHVGDGDIYNRDTYLAWLAKNGGHLKMPEKKDPKFIPYGVGAEAGRG